LICEACLRRLLQAAQAAQRNFVQFGPAAAHEAAEAQGLVERIEGLMRQ